MKDLLCSHCVFCAKTQVQASWNSELYTDDNDLSMGSVLVSCQHEVFTNCALCRGEPAAADGKHTYTGAKRKC